MKPWYRSRTVWFNALAVLVLVANQFGFTGWSLDPEVSTGIVALVNLYLRFITKQPIVGSG